MYYNGGGTRKGGGAMRLLIAEDERDLARALSAIFEKHNYGADQVYNGIDALDYALSGAYDGIVLDVMMPGLSGFEVVRRLREQGVSTPVLLLTAKSEVPDKVEGLDAGADDYLAKPFAVAELLARVRALLRRSEHIVPDVLEFEGLSLNAATYELGAGGKGIRLSNREYQMMEMLLKNPRHIVSTEQFMERVWGWESDVGVSIVWVYISNLRKKLAELGTSVEIRATRGVGYSVEAAR